MPIVGLERLSLKFNSITAQVMILPKTMCPLQIYKVDKVKRDPPTDGAQLYQIYFCSPKCIITLLLKLVRHMRTFH